MLSEFKEKEKAIRKVLMKEWDPLDVNDVPEGHYEYDNYIPMIYKIAILQKSKKEIFDFLLKIEKDFMGLTGQTAKREKRIARATDKLINL